MSSAPAPNQTGSEAEKAAPAIYYDVSDMQPWREFAVVLFNDDTHSFTDVEAQIMRATGCAYPVAQSLAARTHNEGRATVAIAGRTRALQIAIVLRQIDLRVALRQIN